MKRETYFKLLTVGLATLLLIGTMVWTGCGKREPPPPSSGGEHTPSPPPPPPPPPPRLPDLMISAIEVFPAQPQAGVRFAVNVYVKNAGEAPSGKYDLAMFIKDVSRGSTYPVGTFRREGMQPAENIGAYSSTDMLVNYPGSHQVHVEIEPFLWEDGNEQNNTAIRAFTVN